MRWDELFDDLAAQYAEAQQAELAAEVGDRVRREIGLLRFVDRLRPAVGYVVNVRAAGGGALEGRLVSAGPDWLLLAEAAHREALVAGHAVLSVAGLAAHSAMPATEGRLAGRLTFAFALRGLVRDRSPVTLTFIDGSTTAGTLDRVGSDFLELAEHAPGELRRRDAVRSVRTVPLTAVAVIRRI